MAAVTGRTVQSIGTCRSLNLVINTSFSHPKMIRMGFLSSFSRLLVSKPNTSLIPSTRSISTNINPLFFKATTCLYAEPLKKKKKMDPAVLKQREERRRKKLEKQIKRLERNARQLKPIDELEVPLKLVDERSARTRTLAPPSPEIVEQRALLAKEWARYKNKEHMKDLQTIDRLIFSQQKALDELRSESEELYQEAIQIDLSLVPFAAKGPVWTPPIENYESPDGEYNDVSRKWD